MSRRFLVVLGVALAVCLLLLLVRGRLEEALEPPRQESEPAEVTESTESANTDAESRTEVAASPVESGTRPSTVRGRVLDSMFRTPLVAVVSPESGPSVVSHFGDGSFQLGGNGEAIPLLTVRSRGYREQVLELTAVSLDAEIEVLLEPEAESGIVARYEDGAPVSGALVEWRVDLESSDLRSDFLAEASRSRPAAAVQRTDGSGRALSFLGVGALATVEDERSGAQKTVLVRPRDVVPVILPRETIEVRFTIAPDDAPLRHAAIDSWRPREQSGMVTRQRTDDAGVVRIAANNLPVLLRPDASLRHRARVYWRSESELAFDPDAHGGFTLTVVAAPADGRLEAVVHMHDPTRSLLFVDAQTGERLSGWATYKSDTDRTCPEDAVAPARCTLQHPSYFERPHDPVELRDGLLTVHPWSFSRLSAAEERGLRPTVRFVVEGYGVGQRYLAELSVAREPLVVPMTKCPSRTLRVLHPDGSPYLGPLGVWSPKGDVKLWWSLGRTDGLHGPIDWPGGDLQLRAMRSDRFDVHVAAEACRDQEIVDVVLPLEFGAILVEGAPPVAAGIVLVARGIDAQRGGRTWYDARAAIDTRGTARFDRLPVGHYVVGPEPWADEAAQKTVKGLGSAGTPSNSVDTGLTAVHAGETTRVEWIGPWCAGRPVEGRVRLAGPGNAGLMVLPVYGASKDEYRLGPTSRPKFRGSRALPAVALDEDGNYHIEPDEPLPLILVAFVLSDKAWESRIGIQAIETFVPGESIEIPVGSLEFVWTGDPDVEGLSITVEVAAESMRYPVRSSLPIRFLPFDVRHPLRIDGIPPHVAAVGLGKRTLPVELSAGECVRYVLDETRCERVPR